MHPQQYPAAIQQKLQEISMTGGSTVYSDEENTYVLLALGERMTGGYDIQVVSAEEVQTAEGNYIAVKAKEIRPEPDAMVIQVITYPTAVYRLPRTELPVKVEWVRG